MQVEPRQPVYDGKLRVKDVPANPPFEEEYLYANPEARLMVPDTVLPAGEAESLFDAVGTKAKREYVQGSYLHQTGYSTKSFNYFLKAVEEDPDNLWLKLRAARAALFLNDLPRSRRLAEEVVEADPDNYTAFQLLANVALARGKSDEAVEWYSKVLDVKPRNIEALENLARLAYDRRDFEQTKEYCARILQITSRNLSAILWHAEASALTGDITHAASLYEQLIRYRPALISRVGEMGIRLVRQGRVDDALELYRRGVTMRPDEEIIRMQWEALLRETQGEEAVLEGYEAFAREYPLDLRIQEIVANYFEREEMTERLIEKRHEMLDIDPRHISSLLSLASIELDRDNFDEADEYFERAIKAGPQHAATYREIAMVYLRQGRTPRAQELLREALAIDPGDFETFIALADLSIKLDDKKKAEEHLKKAIDLAPANERVLRLLGDFYRLEGRLYEASQIYEQVLAVTPTDSSALLTLASLYMQLGNTTALDLLQEKTARLANELPTFFSDYGVMAMRQGEWDRARWGLERAIDQYPNNLALYQALASTYLRMGEPELAEKALDRAKPHFPDTDEGRTEYDLTLATHYMQARQYDRAVPIIRDLIERTPEEMSLQSLLMEALIKSGQMDEAHELLNEVIRTFAAENPYEVRKFRANTYRQMGDYERAAQVLLPSLDEAEDKADAWFDLALIYGDMGNVEEAERYYGAIIRQVEPEEDKFYLVVNALNNLAYLYANKDTKLDKAEEYVTRAHELNPGADYILDTMGWVAFRQGKYEEAEEYLKKAERMALPDAEIYEHLAELYRSTGRAELALKYYRKALEIDPGAKRLEEKMAAMAVASTEESAEPATP